MTRMRSVSVSNGDVRSCRSREARLNIAIFHDRKETDPAWLGGVVCAAATILTEGGHHK